MLDSADLLSDNIQKEEVVGNAVRTALATASLSLLLLKCDEKKKPKCTPVQNKPEVKK